MGVSRISVILTNHSPSVVVDGECAGSKDTGIDGGLRIDAAQGDPDPRQQLLGPERFRDVVVCTEIERVHLVGLGAARRQDDDRHLRGGANAATDLGPFDVGQPEIEHDESGCPVAKISRACGAGAGDVDFIAA